MTAEKTGFECCVEERMREHEERIRLREMKTARKEAGIRRLPAERVRESEERARLRELRRQPCGAETRAGHPCQRKGLGRGGRCANHGGPAQGRRPLRVVSGLPRRSAGVGTLAQPANADLVLRVTALFMPTLSPMAIKGEVDSIISTGVVAELGDDELVLVEVNCYVVDPSGHGLERYCCLKDQGRAQLIDCGCSRCGTVENGCRQENSAADWIYAVHRIRSSEIE